MAPKLAAHVPPEASVIEFGPGTEIAFRNKSWPFLKEIEQFNSYIPIDLCETYLNRSREILGEELPDISVQPIKTDFIKNVDIVGQFPRPVVFFKGSTITNLSTKNCLDFLKRISQALQPEGLLIVGVDTNQNEPSLRKAYDDGKMANVTLSILHYMNRDLPVSGFDAGAFDYKFNWDPSTHCVEHNVIATEDQDFVLDGIPVEIEKGTKFHLLSSYKYPVDYFQEIAKTAGLQPLDCFVDPNGRMAIHVLQAAA